jgi:hypothetical protein
MTHNKSVLAIIPMILLFNGCTEKDDLTLPVKVDFRIGISENSAKDEYLTFTGGKIGIRGIRFEGKREAGGDVFFETDPELNLPELQFNASPGTSIISDFDIPQGIFNYMKWEINLKEIETDGLNDDDTDSHYTGLAVSGTYSNLSGVSIPFIIAIDNAELLSVNSYDQDGNSRIALSVNKDYEAILLLDLAYAFHSISRESLEDADVSDENGTPIIVISIEQNDDLYEDLLYRIDQSAKVIVK